IFFNKELHKIKSQKKIFKRISAIQQRYFNFAFQSTFNKRKFMQSRYKIVGYDLWVSFLIITSCVPNINSQVIRPSITITTDQSWEVSGLQIKFGEYPLSAEQIA